MANEGQPTVQLRRSAPAPDQVADVPGKRERPRAWDVRTDRYQWHFGAIPRWIRVRGQRVPNPFRQRAIFVVHGIGEQAPTETAAMLRLGLEDVLPLVDPQHWDAREADGWIVPQPYIADGFWGDYQEITRMEETAWARMTEPERLFFQYVWTHRSVSATSTFWWLTRTAGRLIVQARGLTRLYYLYLVPLLLTVVLLSLLRPQLRRFVRGYLNDVRLYLDPQGDVELEIVQRIDHLVGAKFLRLLGLDWNLDPLPEAQRLSVWGERAEFERVTWVAHSLGTVISYNVLGDILARCSQVGPEDTERFAAARRVVQSLEGFVTLGSPLDKVRFLFPQVLRNWPPDYLPGGARSLWGAAGSGRRFWTNYHYTSDPVSGRLDAFTHRGQNLVANLHPRGWRLPGWSHLLYWRETPLLAAVLALTFGEYVGRLPLPTRSARGQQVGLLLGALFWAILVPVAGTSLAWWLWRTLGLGRLFGG